MTASTTGAGRDRPRPRPPRDLALRPQHGQPARGHDAARRGQQVAGHHARGRLLDDRDVGADRRPAGGRRGAADRRGRRRLGAARARDRRARRRPRREQHDQRLLRPRGRGRHRRVRPRPVRAAPDPVGLGDEAPARDRDPASPTRSTSRSCCSSPRRAARSSSPSRSPGCSSRVFYVAPPIRLKHIGLGEPGVFIVWGPLMVVGTFFVATGDDARLGVDRLAALRDPRDDGPVRQAHRQDRRRPEEGRPDAAGDPRRVARPAASRRR